MVSPAAGSATERKVHDRCENHLLGRIALFIAGHITPDPRAVRNYPLELMPLGK
jgi:hypothetical protein